VSKHHCPKCKWLILCDIICPASSILKFEEAAKKLSKHHCPHRNRASKVYPLPQIRNLSKGHFSKNRKNTDGGAFSKK